MRDLRPIFPLKWVGFHPKFPVSEKNSWEPGSQVPEENPTLLRNYNWGEFYDDDFYDL